MSHTGGDRGLHKGPAMSLPESRPAPTEHSCAPSRLGDRGRSAPRWGPLPCSHTLHNTVWQHVYSRSAYTRHRASHPAPPPWVQIHFLLTSQPSSLPKEPPRVGVQGWVFKEAHVKFSRQGQRGQGWLCRPRQNWGTDRAEVWGGGSQGVSNPPTGGQEAALITGTRLPPSG